MQVNFTTKLLEEAKKKYNKEVHFTLGTGKDGTKIELNAENKPFLQYLQDNDLLSLVQSKKIAPFLLGTAALKDVTVKTSLELYNVLLVTQGDEPSLELAINGKWYPVLSTLNKFKTFTGETVVALYLSANLGSLVYQKVVYFGPWNFLDSYDKVIKKSITDVFKDTPVRLTTPENIEKFKDLSLKVMKLNDKAGKVMDAFGAAISYDNYWHTWDPMKLGTKQSPSTVVIEPELEEPNNHRGLMDQELSWNLPFVRCFSMQYKQYVYIDVDEISDHVFNRDGINKIVLPERMKLALNGIFNASQVDVFGDLFHGRHGGIVVLANGPSGVGKCLGKGTPVLLANGSIKPVENIKIGDQLLGPDGLIRNVLSTNIGTGPLYRIDPIKGNSWVCNDVHILSLRNCSTENVIDIPLNEWQEKSLNFKNTHKLFSVGIDNFFKNKEELSIDPYFLGIWFGDGTKHIRKFSNKEYLNDVSVSNTDQEVIKFLYSYAEERGLSIREKLDDDKCPQYFFINKSNSDNRKNKLLDDLRELVGININIPKMYLTSSREERLQFLAGYLDSDGELSNNCFVISQKRDDWAEAIVFLAQSLGFCATLSKRKSGYKKTDGSYFEGNYNVITISGNTDEIPVKIDYKKASERKQIKNSNHTGFSVSPIGEGEYYGFTLDGDGRFLLGDFTVTHNTLTAEVFSEYQERPLYSLEMSEIGTTLVTVEANLRKIFKRAKKWNAVLLFDEADIFLSERVASDLERSAIVGIFLRLLDYYEGTFFLTTNRGAGIDTAFKSRVTLYLDYPALSVDTRKKIWSSMLESAEINIDKNDSKGLELLAGEELNGRQIRNQVRLIKLMYGDKKVSHTDIRNNLEFAAK